MAGGFNSIDTALSSAQIYDPTSGAWSITGNLADARYFHTDTLLPDGKVLVVGGTDGSNSLTSAELFDPATGTWSGTGSLSMARDSHTANLLPNGKVLVTGGKSNGQPTATAELYDPETGTWKTTGNLGVARFQHTTTLLPNGKVLAVGGVDSSFQAIGSAELYDSASGTWSGTGSMAAVRYGHAAVLLPNGKVLAAGGLASDGAALTAELYDPASGTWAATGNLIDARYFHTVTLLPGGQVLAAGGGTNSPNALASAELYDPVAGTWTATGSLGNARAIFTATLLQNGNVLAAGGFDGSNYLGSAELYLGPAPPPIMLNISTRMRVLTGDQVLIAGFIITGTDLKRVLIRGIGPSLSGVGATLPDPTLELHQGNTTLVTNDNWKTRSDGTSQQADIEETTIPPANDLESAIVVSLSPGAYTAVLADKNGATGVGLVELYDLGQGANSKLANISTRGFVDTGNNVMIGGLIVGGGSGSTTVVVRALGPSVPVANALSDPTLELHDASGTTIATNDNWKIDDATGQSQEAAIRATTIPPTNDLESALLQTLPAGNYTAVVRGKNNTTGVGLVEAYNLQ
jgi:hypothetical protein